MGLALCSGGSLNSEENWKAERLLYVLGLYTCTEEYTVIAVRIVL